MPIDRPTAVPHREAPPCAAAAPRRPARPAALLVATAALLAFAEMPAFAGSPPRNGSSQPQVRAATAVQPPAPPRVRRERTATAPRPAAVSRSAARVSAASARPPARQAAPRRPAASPAPAALRPPAPPASGGGGTREQRDSVILATLEHAAHRTGANPALLAAMALRESRLDPRARNPRSTASGLMQFTEATWLETIRDHGPAHGLAREAATLTTDPQTGAVRTRNARDRAYLLNLRFNPRLAALMAASRAAAMREDLEAALGRPATETDLYAAHLLGGAGARRFLAELARAPAQPAADVVTRDAVARNRSVFFRGDEKLALREVHAAMARSLAEGRVLLASAAERRRVEVAEAPPELP